LFDLQDIAIDELPCRTLCVIVSSKVSHWFITQ